MLSPHLAMRKQPVQKKNKSHETWKLARTARYAILKFVAWARLDTISKAGTIISSGT